MKTVYENFLDIGPQNPCVISYDKTKHPGAMPNMHYHPYYEIYFLISGQRKFFFHNKILKLTHGNVMIIKPNEVHRAIPIDDAQSQEYERYLLDIDVSLFSKIERYNKEIRMALKRRTVLLSPEKLLETITILRKIEQELKEKDAQQQASVRNYIERILIDLCRQEADITTEQNFSKNDIRIQEAIDYIVSNYNKKITLKECAKVCVMGESNFTKVFHEIVGMNLKSYINLVRIEKACEFLTDSDLSITEIAEKIGFDSVSYFAELFKKAHGVSPKAFRNADFLRKNK